MHQSAPKLKSSKHHLRRLPVKAKGELPAIPVDARAAEVRAIKTAWLPTPMD